MEGQRQNGKGGSRTVPVQQDFLFVDAAQAKTSRQGRRNARSFVMQKARRERPWSTSKHASKNRKHSESTSPGSANTPESLLLTPKTATPSPPLHSDRPDYFTALDHQPNSLVAGRICHDCQIFQCRPGQRLCPRCLLLKPASPIEDPNNSLFDPFGTSPIEMNATVSELLEHCKLRPRIFITPAARLPSVQIIGLSPVQIGERHGDVWRLMFLETTDPRPYHGSGRGVGPGTMLTEPCSHN